MSFVYEV